VLQMNREVTGRPRVLSRVLIAASAEFHRNVRLKHSLCVGSARAYTIER
jgi:hypothetical protein